MANPVSTGNFPKALWPGIKTWYAQEYAEHPEEYKQAFEIVSSNKNFEEDVQYVGLGLAPVKGEGQPISFDAMQQGYLHRATHVAYALGFIITYEELRDNLYMNLGEKRSKALAFSMRQTKETICANVFNNGFDSNFTSNPGDGLELFSTVHPLVGGGTEQNELTTAADLSELALEQAVIDIMNYVNDRNLKISVMPKCLLIPTALWAEAQRIYYSALQNDSANNALNALASKGVFPEGIKINHYLTDADAWFIKTNCRDGLKYYDREGDTFDQDNEFTTKNFRAAGYMRFSTNWSDFRQWYGSPGA